MLEIAQSAGKINSLAYIVGVYLGDGCIYRYPKQNTVRIQLSVIDKDFIEKFAQELENLLGRKPKIHKCRDNRYKDYYYYNCMLGCKDLCDWLEEVTVNKEYIPKFIFESNDETKKEFISGLLDSEGYASIVKWDTKRDGHHWEGKHLIIGIKACSYWMVQLHSLLQSMGVKTQKMQKCKPRKEWYKIPYVFRINPQSFRENGLYFNIKRKQERIIPSETTRHTATNADDIVRTNGKPLETYSKSM